MAKQKSGYLLHTAISDSSNMPPVNTQEEKVIAPWLQVAGHLKSFISEMMNKT